MRSVLTTLCAFLWLIGGPPNSEAGTSSLPRIMLFALSPTTSNLCNRTSLVPADCAGFDSGVHDLPLYPERQFVYLLVVNGPVDPGVAGLQCGLRHSVPTGLADGAGLDIDSWRFCASQQHPTPGTPWGADGSGILLTWDSTTRCQRNPGTDPLGVVAVAGYFYCTAYSPVVLSVIPRPQDDAAKIGTCDGSEVYFDPDEVPSSTQLGSVGFGLPGNNPCGRELPIPLRETTWSGVKSLLE